MTAPIEVDVVVPCYKHGAYLQECVASILSQRDADVRVLIVDNASPDGSAEVAHRIATEDGRVEVLARTENKGFPASLNAGVDWASREFFTVLCADDWLAPGSYARAAMAMRAHPDVAFAFGHEAFVREDEPWSPVGFREAEPNWSFLDGAALVERMSLPPLAPVGCCTMLTRTAVQKEVGHYDPEFRYRADLNMMLRLAAGNRVAATTAVQTVRRLHAQAISADLWHALEKELMEIDLAFERMFETRGGQLQNARALQTRTRRNLGNRAYWAALSHRIRGHRTQSDQLFAIAHRLAPWSRALPPVDHLFRVEQPISRIVSRLREARRRLSARNALAN